mgnify:CR=1 FL=1
MAEVCLTLELPMVLLWAQIQAKKRSLYGLANLVSLLNGTKSVLWTGSYLNMTIIRIC